MGYEEPISITACEAVSQQQEYLRATKINIPSKGKQQQQPLIFTV